MNRYASNDFNITPSYSATPPCFIISRNFSVIFAEGIFKLLFCLWVQQEVFLKFVEKSPRFSLRIYHFFSWNFLSKEILALFPRMISARILPGIPLEWIIIHAFHRNLLQELLRRFFQKFLLEFSLKLLQNFSRNFSEDSPWKWSTNFFSNSSWDSLGDTWEKFLQGLLHKFILHVFLQIFPKDFHQKYWRNFHHEVFFGFL